MDYKAIDESYKLQQITINLDLSETCITIIITWQKKFNMCNGLYHAWTSKVMHMKNPQTCKSS